MIRIFLADDHPMVREAIKSFLARLPDIHCVGEASSGHETVAKVQSLDVDIVLLDVTMPGRGGLETLEVLKGLSRAPRVLMLTGRSEKQYAVRCMKSGADGYLTKGQTVQHLRDAIQQIADGHKFITPRLAEQIAFTFDSSENRDLHEQLNNREFEIMCKIAEGLSVSEIADELFLSAKTISTYRSRIMRKLQLRNSSELMHYVIKEGFID
ncbi:MAG: response regulator transcription factor [Acidobacteriota bacterium]